MPERALSPVVRIVAGIVSLVLIVVTGFIALSQVRAGWGSDLGAWLAAIAMLIVTLGAIRLFRAALRGTITIRDRSTSRTE
jgi:hypothetical protein